MDVCLLGIGYLLMLTGTLNMADMHGQGETKADTLARSRTADDDYSSRHVGSSLARTNTIMACVGVFEEELPDYYMDGVRKLVVLHQMY